MQEPITSAGAAVGAAAAAVTVVGGAAAPAVGITVATDLAGVAGAAVAVLMYLAHSMRSRRPPSTTIMVIESLAILLSGALVGVFGAISVVRFGAAFAPSVFVPGEANELVSGLLGYTGKQVFDVARWSVDQFKAMVAARLGTSATPDTPADTTHGDLK